MEVKSGATMSYPGMKATTDADIGSDKTEASTQNRASHPVGGRVNCNTGAYKFAGDLKDSCFPQQHRSLATLDTR